MNRYKPFFQGMSKAALIKEVQSLLSGYKLDDEFGSTLLSDLFHEKHYYCSMHNLRPTMFRKKFRKGGGYNFEAYFPCHGWHRASWRQCVEPKSSKDWIHQALRDAVQPIVAAYKLKHPICEHCHSRPSEEVDHALPEFKTILENALKFTPNMTLESILDNIDFWEKEQFSLPDDNPALIYTILAHEHAALQALCKKCHCEVAKQRRNA